MSDTVTLIDLNLPIEVVDGPVVWPATFLKRWPGTGRYVIAYDDQNWLVDSNNIVIAALKGDTDDIARNAPPDVLVRNVAA
jgi:hypothetical protein